jgi:hypothetical protein
MLVALATAASAAPGDRERAWREREAREHPEYYSCGLTRSVAGGQLRIGAQVELEGRPSSYRFSWEGGAAREGLSMTYDWSGPSSGPVEAWHARLTLATRQHLGFASPVLRDANGRLLYEPPFGGSYGARSPGSSLRYYSFEVPARVFADALAVPGGALVELRARRSLPAVPVDPAPLGAIQAAIAAERGELARRIADYRNRCEPVRDQEVVVT